MKKFKEFLLKNRVLLLSSLITFLLLTAIFIYSGNWPFGKNSVALFDMSAQVVPLSQLFKDIFQGKATLFFTNRLAGGISIFGSLIYFAMSPFLIILMIAPRADAFYWINLVFVLYLVSMTLSMSYAFSKLFAKIDDKFKVLISVCYSFCGYIFLNYTFIVWLNFMVLLPVMVVAFKRMIESEKYLVFSFLTFLYIISCFGVGTMSQCLFLVIYFVYVLLCVPKDKQKEVLVRLTIAMFVAVAFSLVFILPAFLESLHSSRTSNLFGSLLETNVNNYWIEKLTFILIDIVFVVFSAIYIIFCKKNNKLNQFIIICFILVYAMLIIDVSLMLFNFGVYFSYPTRSASIIIVLAIFTFAKFLQENTFKEKDNKQEHNIQLTEKERNLTSTAQEKTAEKKGKFSNLFKENKYLEQLLSLFLIAVFVVVFILVLKSSFNDLKTIASEMAVNKILKENLKSLIAVVCVLVVGVIFSCLFYFRKMLSNNLFKVFIFIILICELVCNCFLMSGVTYDVSKYVAVNSLMEVCEPYDRVIDYTKNLPSYNNVSGISIFSSIINENNQKTISQLGYKTSANTVGSEGGTLFSQSVMGVKYIYSARKKDESYLTLANKVMYEKTNGKTSTVYLYSNKFATTGAFLVDELFEFDESVSIFDNQNRLAKSMGATNNIFSVYDLSQNQKTLPTTMSISRENLYRIDNDKFKAIDSDNCYLNLRFDFDEPVIIYLSIKSSQEDKIYACNFEYTTSQKAGSYFCQEISENIFFKVKANQEVRLSDFSIGVLNLEEYAKQFEKIKERQVDIEYTANGFNLDLKNVTKEQSLLVSNVYYEDYKATVNGKAEKIYSSGANLIGINLVTGKNEVKVSYHYPHIAITLVVSLIFIGIAVSLIIIYKKKKDWFKRFEKPIYCIYVGYTLIFILIFYVISLGLTIGKIIS